VAAIDAGIYRGADFFEDPDAKPTHQSFAEYADAWLETFVGAKSTRRSYKTAINASWKPGLGELIVQQSAIATSRR